MVYQMVGKFLALSDGTHNVNNELSNLSCQALGKFYEISNVHYTAPTSLIVIKLSNLSKQGLSFTHINFTEDLRNLKVLYLCFSAIGIITAFFSFSKHGTSRVFIEL